MTKQEMIAEKERLEKEINRVNIEDSIGEEFDEYAFKLAFLKATFEKNGFTEEQAFAMILKLLGGACRG